MNNINLVLTDLDGTVAQFGKHIVSDAVRQTIISCEDKGVKVVPVTGRYYRMAAPTLELLGFDDMGIFDNGATIQNCVTGEVLWSNWIDVELTKVVSRICAPYAIILDYTEDHAEHVPAHNELELIDMIDQTVSHVYALVPLNKLDEVWGAHDTVQGITYYTAASTRDDYPDAKGIQINKVGADKFHGVEALRQILHIQKEETLAIGDGDNDIALFENANVKIAMGNATDLLKEKADDIVRTIDEDGFVDAMQKYVLNN